MKEKLLYEEFDHTADIGIRVKGKDLADLFVNAAAAMFDIILNDVPEESEKRKYSIALESESSAELLRGWMAELLYFHAADHVFFVSFHIEEISENIVKGTADAIPMIDRMIELATEIKAVTYHELSVTRVEDGYEARLIFDT